MPKRFKALAAVLLAIVVCLVLVLPQVDLDDGVLSDIQTQVLLLIFMSWTAILALFLPPELAQFPREACPDGNIPVLAVKRPCSFLRC